LLYYQEVSLHFSKTHSSTLLTAPQINYVLTVPISEYKRLYKGGRNISNIKFVTYCSVGLTNSLQWKIVADAGLCWLTLEDCGKSVIFALGLEMVKHKKI